MEIADFGFLFEVERERCILKKVLQPDYVLTIPSFVKGKPVEEIAERAFERCTGVSHLTLPPTVGKIRSFAFAESDFKQIERSINNKSPILYVDKFAFADSQVESVKFGGATFLETSGYQFKGCNHLHYIDSLNIRGMLPMGSFMDCGLSYFVFSDGCKIAFDAFKGTDLEMAIIAGTIGSTSNFFPTHKSAKIICEEDNPIVDMTYEGYNVAIKEKESAK